jgi:hypothetical protein
MYLHVDARRALRYAEYAILHATYAKCYGAQLLPPVLQVGTGAAIEQCGLILADMLRAKLIGTTMKISTEVFNGVEVSVDGGLGVVAAPQLLKHDLT